MNAKSDYRLCSPSNAMAFKIVATIYIFFNSQKKKMKELLLILPLLKY